jgi:hypothetical protein
VFRANGLDADATDIEPFPGRDLDDVVSGPAHEPSESLWHNDPRPAANEPKGRQVQVIVMRVGDEDGVDADVVDEMRDGIGVPMEHAQTINEERVGENADAVHLEEDRRVSEVAKTRTHGPSVMRA